MLFDGRVEEAVAQARSQWAAVKAAAEAKEPASEAPHALSYWQQNDRGGWVQAP